MTAHPSDQEMALCTLEAIQEEERENRVLKNLKALIIGRPKENEDVRQEQQLLPSSN